MSDVKAVRYLLANSAPLVAVVPAAQIVAGVLPQGTALPAIAVSHVSTVRQHLVAATATQLCISRVQVTVLASTYPSQKDVLALVRAALPRSRGTVNGVNVDSILHDLDGPDFRDDEAGVFMGSADFIVRYVE
jgi:hypothetical protein